jgi:hypothetical protein
MAFEKPFLRALPAYSAYGVNMNEWSHLTEQIVEALSDVPASECGPLLAYALAVKYNLPVNKGDGLATAREIAMILFQVPDEEIFSVVAEAYSQSTSDSDGDFPGALDYES